MIILLMRQQYQLKIEYNKPYQGQEPFCLKPGEIDKEELGNWYIGCELTEIKLLKYCESK